MISSFFPPFFSRFKRQSRLSLQSKIILTLVGVMLPTFAIVVLLQFQFAEPILQDEMKQIGINAAKTLASEISSRGLIYRQNSGQAIDRLIQEVMYAQPNLLRIDVVTPIGIPGDQPKKIASSAEDEPNEALPKNAMTSALQVDLIDDENGLPTWEIAFPIETKTRLLGSVHVTVSNRLVKRIARTLWYITVVGACFSVIVLLTLLSYFLRRAIASDQKLIEAETENLELYEKLHDAEIRLLNSEKLAVMGQLTASFAHEVGTPLAAISGHLGLLKDEIAEAKSVERVEIIESQAHKIAQIVRNFLQSTTKPQSQRQLVHLHEVADRVLGLVRPRLESIRIVSSTDYDRGLRPLRLVPLEIEQIILNLVNNSIDSLQAKSRLKTGSKLSIEIATRDLQREGHHFAILTVTDTGEGIAKQDLKNVFRPFFTTKKPGEGTGLGLSIIQDLVKKYGGNVEIESKKSAWTKVILEFPYAAGGTE